MVDVQLEIICLAMGDLTPDAGRESRAEGFHQPEKCLGIRTMSGSNLSGGLAAQHKGRDNLSVIGLRFHRAPSWAHWHIRFGGSDKITL